MLKRGLTKTPGSVQLPGGIRLDGILFKVVQYDEDRRPQLFQIMPPGSEPGEDMWTLYAIEEAIRSPKP